MTEPKVPPDLKGSQRKWLRGKAHSLEPIVHVGHAGVTDGVAGEVDAALMSHELIKVKLHAPEDKKALAAELGARAGADVVGLVGHVVVLYRPHPTEPQIQLPVETR